MIFHEIYGCYYNTVAKIIDAAIDGNLDKNSLIKIIEENAFEESILLIEPALANEQWQLVDEAFETPVIYHPQMPLSTLQLRWLKTILSDPRIRLFLDDNQMDYLKEQLSDTEPLFDLNDVVYFDRYADGDPYDDETYIANFRKILEAVRKQKCLKVKFKNSFGKEKESIYSPKKIEYSDNEDKFRMLAAGREDIRTVNIARIIECDILDRKIKNKMPKRFYQKIVFELQDERNTLERVMMKFAHYEKRIYKLKDNKYRVELRYDADESLEILIRLMSFGRFIRITEGEDIKTEIKRRVIRQKELFEK